jgi:hypothetical protein
VGSVDISFDRLVAMIDRGLSAQPPPSGHDRPEAAANR